MNNKTILSIICAVLLAWWMFPEKYLLASEKELFSHEDYNQLLEKYVKDGLVQYRGLKKDESVLNKYLARVGAMNPACLNQNQQIAFYINAYNAYTLKVILENYPLTSIRKISGVWSNKRYLIHGKKVSLEYIEHEILRKQFNELRIHFALVCASKGCPYLRSEAYVGSRLSEQLDDNARVFFKDKLRGVKAESRDGVFFGTNHYLHVTKIFNWFKKDFVRDGNTVLGYVEKYAPEDVKKFIAKHRSELSIKYLDYDWSLNEGAFN